MIATLVMCAAALVVQDTLPPAARRVLADVRYLADDAREGRGVGTKGIDAAARYIQQGFASAGLRASLQAFTISRSSTSALLYSAIEM